MSESKALQPGPELDGYLALNVKGWKWFQNQVLQCNRLIPPQQQVGILPQYLARHPSWPDGEKLQIPSWSTDPVLMWEIVEAMKARGYDWRIQGGTDLPVSCKFWWANTDSANGWLGWHETPAGAVALAALAAVESEKRASHDD